MSITCVLLQKRLILSNREDALKEQQKVLQDLAEAHRPKGPSYVGAGGLLKTVDSSIGEGEGVAACILGSFENAEHLVLRYLGENFSKNTKLEDAEVVCHLYKVFGRVLPQKLRGDFCFLLFDPSQGRVLAAVSPSWKAPLLQARGADGSLIITSSSYADLPPGAHSLLLIPPGSLKYGWSSEPQEYALPATHHKGGPSTPTRRGQHTPSPRAAASAAARSAFEGITEDDSMISVQTSEPSFADSEGGEPQSPAPKKTRRGKRAGKNQKLRAEQAALRLSMEGRPSMDGSLLSGGMSFQRMGSLQSVASSFTSRADEQNWWRTDTPRQSLDLPSMSGGAAPGAMPARRASMSATAPPFVPAKFGSISRQSVPAVRSRTSALNFSGPHPRAPACLDSHAFVVGPRRSTSQVPPEQRPAASPFEGVPHSGAGKADAAWNEENPPLPERHAALASSSGTSGCEISKSAAAALEGSTGPSSGSGGTGVDAGKLGSSGLPVSLPRLVTPGAGGMRGASPRGGSPKGASPGGSPHKPPRVPGKGTLKHLFKAMTSKRPSQVDLRADAGTDATLGKSRSASHGNLLALGLVPPDVPSSGHASGSESSSSNPQMAGHRRAKHPAPRQPTSRENEEAFMLSNLKISDPEGTPPPATSWLARTTRSIFGKSKSCTDLRDLQAPLTTQVS